MNLRKSVSTSALLLSFAITTLVSINLNWGKDWWRNILEADARGYYAYLPAVFIYQDLNFGFFERIEKEKYYDPQLFYDYRAGTHGATINKYYCGTALAQMPFFLVAHWLSRMNGNDSDGFSKWYMLSVAIAALFYLLAGLYFLNLLLASYRISERNRAWVLVAVVFGTHLFYYTVGEPGMSHIYSFGFITAFMYVSRTYFLKPGEGRIAFIALLLGCIVLIRPVNVLVLFFVPVLAGDIQTLRNGIVYGLRRPVWLIGSLFVVFSVCSVQLIIYKISTGHFFVYSYTNEGFNFTEPHFLEILFSYRKGLFLYTPLLFFALFGIVALWKRSAFMAINWMLFFVLITYLFSSWWMWYYGGSFSGRVYVEFLAVFMLLLGFMLEDARRQVQKILLRSGIIGLVLICQIQTYQYRYHRIHWSDMTKEKYLKEFLRIDKLL